MSDVQKAPSSPRVVRMRKTSRGTIEITFEGPDDGQPVPPERVYLYPEPITITVAAADLERVVRETSFVRSPQPLPRAGKVAPQQKLRKSRRAEPVTDYSPYAAGREAHPRRAEFHGCVPARTAPDSPAECHLVFAYHGGGDLRVCALRSDNPYLTAGRAIELRLPAVVTRARDEPHIFGVPHRRLAQIAKAHRGRRLEISECGGTVTVGMADGATRLRAMSQGQWLEWQLALARIRGVEVQRLGACEDPTASPGCAAEPDSATSRCHDAPRRLRQGHVRSTT